MQRVVMILTMMIVLVPEVILAKEGNTVVGRSATREIVSTFLVTAILVGGFMYARTKNKMIREHNARVIARQEAAKKAEKQAKKERYNKK